MMATVWLLLCNLLWLTPPIYGDLEIAEPTEQVNPSGVLEWDERGYIIYCPCMGRFGNQAEQFLGALGFAKSLDRTLILPPWRTYKNIAFDEWFKVEPLQAYHRVILADDFMVQLAPSHWSPGERTGWCFSFNKEKTECDMKTGVPFEPFWTELGVDFSDSVLYDIGYDESNIQHWTSRYPPDRFPVMAFKGPPASFPVREKHMHLQQYLHWSEVIDTEANLIIEKHFGQEIYVGIHLRNGVDWVNACGHADGRCSYMASNQCLGYGQSDRTVTAELCLPSQQEVLRLTRKAVLSTNAKFVFVATDKSPLIKELEEYLKDKQVVVFHLDPWLPQIDQAILGKSHHFIGNCVSSFTSFVARYRLYNNQPTSYWGFS